MEHALEVWPDAGALVRAAAQEVARRAAGAVADHGTFTWAVSGGHTPRALFALLAQEDLLPWGSTTIYQVDERAAPDGHDDRNLTHLLAALGKRPVRVAAMPVTGADLDAAARAYAAELPGRFDLVHLGIGADGHTASLVPGDPVLEVADRLVAPTAGEYQGWRRMTLTFPALSRTDGLLWLVEGAEKRDALARLLALDASVPAGRVRAPSSLVLADAAAADR